MKTQLALPTGIKKLTNIAVVRLKKHGVRFEIACYKNTVGAWRDGFEKDIDNVLQTTQIYNNVSKGIFAKEEDLLKAFGSADEKVVAKLILETGEVQVSDKERKNTFDNIFRDAVNVLVDKCVNPETNRPYPPGMIERALREVHFQVDPTKSAKQQALAALPRLKRCFQSSGGGCAVPIPRCPTRSTSNPRWKCYWASAPRSRNRRRARSCAPRTRACTGPWTSSRRIPRFSWRWSPWRSWRAASRRRSRRRRGAPRRRVGRGDAETGRGNVGAYAMRDLEGALAGNRPRAATARLRWRDEDRREKRRQLCRRARRLERVSRQPGPGCRGSVPPGPHRGCSRRARLAKGAVRADRRDTGRVAGGASASRGFVRG